MEQDLQGLRVGSHYDELGDAAVQCLGGLVRALLQLLVVASLLGQVQDLHRHLRVRERVSLRVDLRHFFSSFL